MRIWWLRMTNPTKVFFLVATVAFVVDVALLILAESGQIGPGWAAATGAVLVFLILLGILVVGRLNSRLELDDIVRRVRDEEDHHETE
jgi:protein-S-isoprenylcysteine O-methyltransferase Ste14